MSKLLIATHNKAKLNEMMPALKASLPNVEVVSLEDLKIVDKPEETGTTFVENAKLKARFYGKLSGLPTIADDGGLSIDVLDGKPGVYSSRWLGRPATAKELINYCIDQMKSVSDSKRSARFETCLYFYNPNSKKEISETGIITGTIAKKAHKDIVEGYQYRSVFVVSKFGKYYLDLTPKEHSQINHRVNALKRLAKKISAELL